MKKKVLLSILALLVIIQFFRIDKTNPAVIAENDYINTANPPENISTILKTSCYDCHSNESKYPWYSNIAPVSWWVKDHINEGREELNFSEWTTFSEKRKKHKLEECIEMIEEGEMPLKSYTIMHGNAQLTADDEGYLIEWFKNELNKKEVVEDEHAAIQLNNGEKWTVVPDMLHFIRNMEEGINNFSQTENPSFEAYQELAVLIDKNIRSLTENCTMEGQAHDELHKWLVPFIGLSEKFDVAENIEEQEKIYSDFKNAFVEFNTYFE
ncbi:MAG: heme-binding domain-containing protein [Vicingaceae bacterium]